MQDNISALKPFSLKEKWIFSDLFEYDSDFEKKIMSNDEDDCSITFFGKLPKLSIDTPFGTYTPDFCYTIQTDNGKQLVLIVEAKGYTTEEDIPQDQKNKINFGKKYFESLNKYYKQNNKNIVISFQTRITTRNLTQIIKQAINTPDNER